MATTEQLVKDVQDLKIQHGVHEERISRAEKEIEQLHAENKAIYEISTNVKILAEGMSSVRQDVADVKDDVKQNNEKISKLDEKFDNEQEKVKEEITNLKNLPDKTKAVWWDKIVWLVVGGVISAGVTALIAALWK